MDTHDLKTLSVRYHPSVEVGKTSGVRVRPRSRSVAIYVHIPFCATRCHFCSFEIVTGKLVNKDVMDEYLDALEKEVAWYAASLKDQKVQIEMIQIGGGTPTILSNTQLERLLDFLFSTLDCSALEEVIVEGFPTTITKEKVDVLARVERLKLNIGIQTFNQANLTSVGRKHTVVDASSTVKLAQDAGIKSVGVDLIFGLPGSTNDDVINDVNTVAALRADHLALYPLWVYENTPVEKKITSGRLIRTPFSKLQAQLATGLALLDDHGYERYTAFHYTRDPKHKHGYGLWQMAAREWLGFGMAAMSYTDGQAVFNERNLGRYVEKIRTGNVDTGSGQRFTRDEEMRFALQYGLRLRHYPTAPFAKSFGCTIGDAFGEELRYLIERGLITCDENQIDLTSDGILKLGAIERYVTQEASSIAADD